MGKSPLLMLAPTDYAIVEAETLTGRRTVRTRAHARIESLGFSPYWSRSQPSIRARDRSHNRLRKPVSLYRLITDKPIARIVLSARIAFDLVRLVILVTKRLDTA